MIRSVAAGATGLLISFTMIFGDKSPSQEKKEHYIVEVKTSQELIENTSLTKRINLLEIKADSLENANNIK